MKAQTVSLSGEASGEIDLDDSIFGLEPRADILHRVVRWQLAKRRAGTHSVKTRTEVSYSTRKIVRQKGSGGARHGSRKAPIFRHGGIYAGPVVRSHAHDLPKKIRRLGLKHALSAKAQEGALIILDDARLEDGKTKTLRGHLDRLGLSKPLVIDGDAVDEGFARAARNLDGVDALPSMGANVYDILRKETVVLTKAGVKALEERLK